MPKPSSYNTNSGFPAARSAGRWRRTVLGVALALFILGSIPYLWAWISQDAEHVFAGYLLFPEDMDAYAALARQAADGHWIFRNSYDVNRPPAVYVNAAWLALGKWQALTGLEFGAALQTMRLGAAIALLFAFAALLNRYARKHWRIPALLVFSFGGGLGWLVGLVRLSAAPPDAYTELFPFMQVGFVPHSALSHALALAVIVLVLRADEQASSRAAGLAGLAMTVLGLVRIYDLLVIWTVVGLAVGGGLIFGAASFCRGRFFRGLLMLVPPLPVFAYMAWLTHAGPGFSEWAMTNSYPPPDWVTFMLGGGLPLWAGLLGAGMLLFRVRNWRFRDGVLAAWLLTAWVVMYGGFVPFAWRTCGLFITPHLLALVWWVARWRPRPLWRWGIAIAFVLAVLPTFGTVLHRSVALGSEQNRYFYRHPQEVSAMRWIGVNRPAARVFAHGHIALKIPAYSDATVLVGHKDLTPDFSGKQTAYEAICQSKRPTNALRLLGLYGLDTIYQGPLDRRFCSLDPASLPGWKRLYENTLVTIYGRESD